MKCRLHQSLAVIEGSFYPEGMNPGTLQHELALLYLAYATAWKEQYNVDAFDARKTVCDGTSRIS